MVETGSSPDVSDEARTESGGSSGRLRRGGLLGIGVAVAASGVLMLATFALAIAPSAYYGPPPPPPARPTASATVSDNGTVTCIADGLKAGSDATCSIASTPTLLGHMTADAQGHAQGTFPLPIDITAGTHTITINGLDPAGSPVSISFDVTVSAAAAAAAAAAGAVPAGVTASPSNLTG